MRIDALVGQAFTLTKTFAPDGTVADVGSVTAAAVDGNGDTVTLGLVTKTGSGTSTVYTVTVPSQTAPTVITITWTADTPAITAVDHVEVTRNGLFTEAQARAWKGSGQQTPFADSTAWTDAALSEWRVRIGDQFEKITGRSWVRRYCRAEFAGSGTRHLHLADGYAQTAGGVQLRHEGRCYDVAPTLLSVTEDGVAVSVSDVKVIGSKLYRLDDAWTPPDEDDPLNVVVEWEYGVWPTDTEANQHALAMLAANASPGNLSAYAVSYSNEDGNQTFTQDGWAYPPKVWSWIKREDSRRVLV